MVSLSEGSISITTIGDNNNSSSKDIDTHGLALGFDTKLNNNDLLGLHYNSIKVIQMLELMVQELIVKIIIYQFIELDL